MDAHEPYRIREDYLDRPVEEIPDIVWNLGSQENELSIEQRRQLEAVYDGSLRYLDAQFGALLDAVEETDRETVVMVVSDHGQSLGENRFWGHGSYLHDELVHIPVLLSASSTDTVEPQELVFLADVPRVLCDFVDVEFDTSSRSVVTELTDGGHRVAVAEQHGPIESDGGSKPSGISEEGYRALNCGGWRLLRDVDADEVTVEPTSGESEMTESEAESVLLRFEEKLGELSEGDTELTRELSDSKEQALEDLGYL